MRIVYKNREILDLSVGGVDSRDYPDFCEAHFNDGFWADTKEPLTDEELCELTEAYSDLVFEMAYQYCIN